MDHACISRRGQMRPRPSLLTAALYGCTRSISAGGNINQSLAPEINICKCPVQYEYLVVSDTNTCNRPSVATVVETREMPVTDPPLLVLVGVTKSWGCDSVRELRDHTQIDCSSVTAV